ncbi:hypothetical protein, partial [Caballeronia sp. ATUFL_M1_KS5A]|uniref:hypothetical protein n=1 Tax=Caballeronia sp. ATUFL_M1_KS5A TaxID=2921778 RepID=UPI002028DA53
TVKRLHADDSADTRVKVGNRQAPHATNKNPTPKGGVFAFEARHLHQRSLFRCRSNVSGSRGPFSTLRGQFAKVGVRGQDL